MLRCQITDDRKVVGSGDERGLNEGRMYMLAATPGHKRVKARGGLARGVHGNDDPGKRRRHHTPPAKRSQQTSKRTAESDG